MKPKVGDLTLVWLCWRRQWLEDSERRIFNVTPTHVCWATGADEGMIAIDKRNGWYGCVTCGRFHECRGDPDACPVRQNPHNYSYVCAFSGRQVAEADAVIGTWDLEQLAHASAHVSESSSSTWVHTTSKEYHVQNANHVSSNGGRKREFQKAEYAKSLRETAIRCNAMTKALEEEEGLVFPEKEENSIHDGDVENDTDRSEDDGDDHGGGGGLISHDSRAEEALRCIVYAPDERTRDCDYQRRLFAPMAQRLAHLAPRFARLCQTRREQTPLPSVSMPPPSPLRTSQLVERKTVAATHRLQQLVLSLVSLFELVTETRSLLHMSQPTTSERGAYYLPIVQRIIELAEGKPLSGLLAGELEQRVAVVLLDLLASPLQLPDSQGNRLFAWVADPWLQWCKRERRLVHVLHRFAIWDKRASKTYHDRLGGQTRKRKRGDSDSTSSSHECPVTPEACAALRVLPKTTFNALTSAANNISHHGNEMRNALTALGHGPIGLYARVHSELLAPPPLSNF